MSSSLLPVATVSMTMGTEIRTELSIADIVDESIYQTQGKRIQVDNTLADIESLDDFVPNDIVTTLRETLNCRKCFNALIVYSGHGNSQRCLELVLMDRNYGFIRATAVGSFWDEDKFHAGKIVTVNDYRVLETLHLTRAPVKTRVLITRMDVPNGGGGSTGDGAQHKICIPFSSMNVIRSTGHIVTRTLAIRSRDEIRDDPGGADGPFLRGQLYIVKPCSNSPHADVKAESREFILYDRPYYVVERPTGCTCLKDWGHLQCVAKSFPPERVDALWANRFRSDDGPANSTKYKDFYSSYVFGVERAPPAHATCIESAISAIVTRTLPQSIEPATGRFPRCLLRAILTHALPTRGRNQAHTFCALAPGRRAEEELPKTEASIEEGMFASVDKTEPTRSRPYVVKAAINPTTNIAGGASTAVITQNLSRQQEGKKKKQNRQKKKNKRKSKSSSTEVSLVTDNFRRINVDQKHAGDIFLLMYGRELFERKSTKNADGVCPICTEEFCSGLSDSYSVVLPCGDHAMCMECLGKTATKAANGDASLSCPLCKTSIENDDVLALVHHVVESDDLLSHLLVELPWKQAENHDMAVRLLHKHNFSVGKVCELVLNMLDDRLSIQLRQPGKRLTWKEKASIYDKVRGPYLQLKKQHQQLAAELGTEEKRTTKYDRNKVVELRKKKHCMFEKVCKEGKKAGKEVWKEMNAVGEMGVEDQDGRVPFDFHGLHKDEAYTKFKEAVMPILPAIGKATLITGKGRHSRDGVATLNKYLKSCVEKERNVRWNEVKGNPGALDVFWVN